MGSVCGGRSLFPIERVAVEEVVGEEQAQGGGGELGEVQSEWARVRGWVGGREGGGRGGR